jgi:hypothetical protein
MMGTDDRTREHRTSSATGPGADTSADADVVISQVYTLLDRDETPLVIRGELLGFTSSRRDEHTHAGPHVTGGDRCAACRWLEVRIFAVDAERVPREDGGDDVTSWSEVDARAEYLVLTYGMTTVPGEIVRRRAAWTDSEFEVVTFLTQRRDGQSFIPLTSERALAQAASFDDRIRDAFVNRAT